MAEAEGPKPERHASVHPVHPVQSGGDALPRDAKVVMAMLRAMGLQEYEPRVVNQFLELMYRYITDVLGDARAYSEHAGKQSIDSDDVQLAIQSRVNFSFTQPPPREVLMELTKARNSVPLPPINLKPGIPLPPDSETLVHTNWQVVLPTMPRRDFVEDFEAGEETMEWEQETEEVAGGGSKSEGEGKKVSFMVATKKLKT